MKQGKEELKCALQKKEKLLAMLAPSFVAEFDESLIRMLRELGFDKVVELTFGAKMVNREYHKILENSKELVISSVCPGIVFTIKQKYPQYVKNLIRVNSPMIATAKICRKVYPKHKIVFISPCEFKKKEAQERGFVDYVIDYQELRELLQGKKIKAVKGKNKLDLFYNEYTKIYPLAGGLSRTSHLKGVLKKGDEKIIDGIADVEKFLSAPKKKIRFLDANFCKGGCIGGPCLLRYKLEDRKKRVIAYMEKAKHESIPKGKEGVIKEAEGIKFSW